MLFVVLLNNNKQQQQQQHQHREQYFDDQQPNIFIDYMAEQIKLHEWLQNHVVKIFVLSRNYQDIVIDKILLKENKQT